MAKRVLCVRIPSFALAVVARAGAPEGPWVVLDGAGPRSRVAEVSEAAVEEGVRAGMSLPQARAICPDLEPVPWPTKEIAAAGEELESLLRKASPQVDAEGGGVFLVGCRGLERLYGVEEDERGLLEAVGNSLETQGWSARLGLAETPFVAFAAATALQLRASLREGSSRDASGSRESSHESPGEGEAASRTDRASLPGGVRSWSSARGAVTGAIVATGRGREVLATLPLEVLPVSDSLADRLSGLGLRTVGEYAALPAASIETRYGAEGLHSHRLARAEDDFVMSLAIPDEPVRRSLEVTATTIEQLQAPLERALDALLEEMHRRDRAPASLGFSFSFDSGEVREMEVSTARPTVRTRVFWDLLALGLARAAFPEPVVEVAIEVLRERRGAGIQGVLFGELGDTRLDGEADELRASLEWIRARYGVGSVVSPRAHSTHRPERRRASEPYLDESGRKGRSSRPRAGEEAGLDRELAPMLRFLDPPLELDVWMESGRLDAFRSPSAPGVPGGRCRVQSMVGPQRISGEWWDAPFERDYYEVLTRDAGLYWVFYGRLERRWFLQAIFD